MLCKTVVAKMNILSVNGDFKTVLLVNYRNSYCFISVIRLLKRKFNNAKNHDNNFRKKMV